MEKKIEKMGHFLVPSSTSEGVVDALRSLADKLNEIIDHLNSQAQPEENEEWEKRFIRRFGYWGEEIKFIKQLLDEREREVRKQERMIRLHKRVSKKIDNLEEPYKSFAKAGAGII